MPSRKTRMTTSHRTILTVCELEGREVPAWFSVALPTPAGGTAGNTMATHSGELAFAPNVTPIDGKAYVFADTATDALTQAFVGTLSVTIGANTTDYPFDDANIGIDAADHKAFLITETNNEIAISFEDMAGLPDCDYDYNDRDWPTIDFDPEVGDVMFFKKTHVFGGGAFGADSGEVEVTVTSQADGKYLWKYVVSNDTYGEMTGYGGEDTGIGIFHLNLRCPDTELFNVSNSMGWEFISDWLGEPGQPGWMSGEFGDIIEMGETGEFSFETEPLPVEETWLEVSDPGYASGGGGKGDGPGEKPKIMITDLYGTEFIIDNPNVLKVGKWENAFNYSKVENVYRADVKPVDPITGNDILDLDPDRFYVWVKDTSRWAKDEHISAWMQTFNPGGVTGYKDPANKIDLVKYEGNSKGIGDAGKGWYVSDSQLLVSNTTDDQEDVPGVGADESGLGELGLPKNGLRWKKSDRTHMIALDGLVGATYENCDIGAFSLKKCAKYGTVYLNINVLNDPMTGKGVVDSLDLVLSRTREIYAQVGIKIVDNIHKNIPSPVNLANGMSTFSSVNGQLSVSAQQKTLFLQNDTNKAIRSPDLNDIEVYYVNFFDKPSVLGIAFADSMFGGSDNSSNSTILNLLSTFSISVLSHEIGHLLLDYGGHVIDASSSTNVMAPQVIPLQFDGITYQRRFNSYQECLIKMARPDLIR
jgi:hypothetical protein